jgi:hypothetical protein
MEIVKYDRVDYIAERRDVIELWAKKTFKMAAASGTSRGLGLCASDER